jgi:hypothetical protein
VDIPAFPPVRQLWTAPLHSKHSRNSSKNHFPSIYAPFSTIFPAAPIRDSPGKSSIAPFSGALAPLKNGEMEKTVRPRNHVQCGPDFPQFLLR